MFSHVKKPVVTDLTKIEGDPTPQSNVLEDREKVIFKVVLGGGRQIDASAPAWSPSGIASAGVMIILTCIMIPSAFAGLGIMVSAPGWLTVTAALIAFCATLGSSMWLINRFAGPQPKSKRRT